MLSKSGPNEIGRHRPCNKRQLERTRTPTQTSTATPLLVGDCDGRAQGARKMDARLTAAAFEVWAEPAAYRMETIRKKQGAHGFRSQRASV